MSGSLAATSDCDRSATEEYYLDLMWVERRNISKGLLITGHHDLSHGSICPDFAGSVVVNNRRGPMVEISDEK